MNESLNALFEASFKKHWDRPALSDYRGVTLHYRDVARKIEKMHIIFEQCGLKKGDKIAICSKNMAHWGVAFLASLTYGAVAVPILHEFKSGNIHHIVNHSDARILFVGDVMWEGLSESEMPGLEAVIKVNDFSMLYARDEKIYEARETLNALFGAKYPKNFRPEHISYHRDEREEVALINYTSGTSGFSKGVLVPYRALLSNINFAGIAYPEVNSESRIVSMLPTAHMYGLMFEFLYEMTRGAHVNFLTRVPSPKIIMEAFADVKPNIIISVPLVIEKIYKKKLQPIIQKKPMRVFMHLPILDKVIEKKILTELVNTFGGNFKEIIIGGAAFNKEVEAFFRRINFPFTVGYGMTECAPIICYAPWDQQRLYSCGKAAPGMQVKIESTDPENIPGEILVKGDNVMLGYYKNEASTKAVFTDDGWMKTGDMGVMDADGYLYIKGRSKSMILGPSGQNIYPEEIESIINNMPHIVESLVVDNGGQITALVVPDFESAESAGISKADIEPKIKETIELVNQELPNYSKITSFKIYPEEFEKTPKRSIKRYLYQ